VASAPHSQQELMLAGKSNGSDDIGYVGTARNEARPPVNHGVIQLPNDVIILITPLNQLTAQLICECSD
jgi:hypothetical protein